jgi:hypothetical protein
LTALAKGLRKAFKNYALGVSIDVFFCMNWIFNDYFLGNWSLSWSMSREENKCYWNITRNMWSYLLWGKYFIYIINGVLKIFSDIRIHIYVDRERAVPMRLGWKTRYNYC